MRRLLMAAGVLLLSAATSTFSAFSAPIKEISSASALAARSTTGAVYAYADSTASDIVQVMIELQDAPAAALTGPQPSAAQRAAAAAQVEQLRTAQEVLAGPLTALGAREIFRAQRAYNGIAVAIERGKVDALLSLPNVAAVHRLHAKFPADSISVQAVGAPTAWSPNGATTGQGVVIGIADTGIDYTHAAFGGPGTPAAYSGNNPATVEAGSFPTAKVIGGIDLAGNSYDGSSSSTPQPDGDPLDCQGHGTAVAGSAAGLGVVSGNGYTGPYSSSLNLEQFTVGPGVAPGASLYAIKMFGCSGGSTLLIAAIEHALDPNGDGDLSDRLAVLSVSISGDFGGDDDPDVEAVDRAARAGLIVVAPAGNAGNTFYSLAAPGNARGAIAVAAISDGRPGAGLAPDTVASFSSRGPAHGNALLKPDLAAPGVGVQAAAKGSGSGAAALSGTSVAAAHAAGAAALILQRNPAWSPEWVKAALITTAREIGSGAPYPASLTGAGALAAGRAATNSLLAFASDSQGAVGISFGAPWVDAPTWSASRLLTIVNTSNYDRQVTLGSLVGRDAGGVSVTPASTSLRIPAGSSAQVPINAQIEAANLRYQADSFTPPTQLPPTQGPNRNFLVEHSGVITVQEQGITRLRLAQLADLLPVDLYIDGILVLSAVQHGTLSNYFELSPGTHQAQLFAIGARGQGMPLLEQSVSLAAGQPATLVTGGWTAELRAVLLDDRQAAAAANAGAAPQIRVVNSTSSIIGAIDIYAGGKLLAAGLTPGQVSAYATVSPGTVEIQVTRAGAGAGSRPLLRSPISILSGQQLDLVVGGRSALRLNITVLDSPLRSGASLRIPYTLMPTLASRSQVADAQPIPPQASDTVTLTIANTGPRNSTQSSSTQVPLASVFELAASSPDELSSSGSRNAADLRYVGVASDAAALGGTNLAYVYFAVATHGSWNTPSDVRFRIEIDNSPTPDGIADARIESYDLGQLQPTPLATDCFVAALFAPTGSGNFAPTGEWFPINIQQPTAGLNTNPYNSNVLTLVAPADTLGLDIQPNFRYRVVSFVRNAGDYSQAVDETPWLSFDLNRPLFTSINRDFNARPLFFDTNGSPIPVTIDREALQARGGGTLLFLHYHNPPASKAELVQVAGAPVNSR